MQQMQGTTYKERVEEAADFLHQKISVRPDIVLQLGTGLGAFAEAVEKQTVIPYEDIPHFPQSTVTSHAGNLIFGTLCGRNVALLQGRLHFYEGYSAREVAFPIRVLSLLGVQTAVITNAAGGLKPDFVPGTIMVFSDHIYLLPDNPLRGPNVEAWGARFPDLSQPYDRRLQKAAFTAATELGFDDVVGGIYVCIPGPSLETPAETRYLRMIGADAVGMSSLPEVLVAIHAGMQVLGLSVVANVNDPDNFTPILLEDIVAAAGRARPRLQQLLSLMLPQL